MKKLQRAVPVGIAALALTLGTASALAHTAGSSHATSEIRAAAPAPTSGPEEAGQANQTGDQGQQGETGTANETGEQGQHGESGEVNQGGEQGQSGEANGVTPPVAPTK